MPTVNHSGPFDIVVQHPSAATPGEIESTRHVVRTFVSAMRLGMFPPSSVGGLVEDPAQVAFTLDATDVPEYAFAVLNGMLIYHSGVVTTLDSWSAGPGGANLCATEEAPPELASELPFPLVFEPDQNGMTPPLHVEIELASPPDEATRADLIGQVRVWHALLQGGYPAPDMGPGQSGTSQPSVRFNDPTTLRYAVDMWSTGYEAFAPLASLLQGWSASGFAVANLEIAS